MLTTRIISRLEAARQGMTHYFTGTPCKNGHLARRFVVSGSCMACQCVQNRKARRMYRELRDSNR